MIKEEKEAIEILKRLQNETDIEMAHVEADDVLTDLLTSLGYQDVVDAYEEVPKWYA